ncbi:MAG: DUF4350 domain-containing protein [Candidatus Rokubacteria bacterium]|nr:DUF4350 domain-containing protein [Candidatus Rokubacteria bacterium]
MIRSALLVLMLCASLAPASAQVQQLADSAFRPTVAEPAFVKRHPKILFDEGHHNFHTLRGRYQSFGALMEADGCTLESNKNPLSAATLSGYDVLVIANAMGDAPETGNDSTVALPALRPDEIEAVHRWVSDGGALLLIADHAPFGAAASTLSERFGVDMSQGYTGDSLQAAKPGEISVIEFTRERKTLGDHPIMNGWNGRERVDRVVAFTGQSLRGPAGSTPLMILSDRAIDIPPGALKLRDDPEAMMSKAVSAKGRSMGVAIQVGRGRAVIQGEAAMLSAQVIVRPGQEPRKFGMNQPGLDNQQYALNVVRWLVGKRTGF